MGEEIVKGIQLVEPVECTIIVQPGNPTELELTRGDDWNAVRESQSIDNTVLLSNEEGGGLPFSVAAKRSPYQFFE